MNDIESLVRRNILQMSPYSTARDEFGGSLGVFLDANENPFPNGWNRYPDPRQKELKRVISSIKGMPAESIFLGNGSDEAIDILFRVFCNPGEDNAVAIDPSYGMYTVAAQINDVKMTLVPLGEGFSLPVEALLDACDSRTRLMWLCSPNNPTGNAFAQEDIVTLLGRFNGIVVVDEAYIDFSGKPSLLPLISKYRNLVVLQTFSKAYGLAALRLGLAFADPFVISIMSNVKYPYNINEATQRLALEALTTKSVAGQVEIIKNERAMLSEALRAFPFVREVYPSDANFLLVRTDDADALYAHLVSDGIIVRNRTRVNLCAGCLRITVGTPEENVLLLKSLENYEKGDIR